MKKIITICLILFAILFPGKSQTGRAVEIVQTPEGRMMKQFQNQAFPIHNRTVKRGAFALSPKLRADEIPPFTLFETFEDWDKTPTWLPQAWTWESQTGISRDNPDNITWFTAAASMGMRPTDGKYYEWINFGVEQRQDEWLISPAIVPQTNDALFFDANFSPFWMLYNMESYEIDFNHPASTLRALISTDNGEHWTSLWNAIDDYRQYTPAELEEFYIDAEWHEVKIALTAYVGKTVKIAFRYEGLFGDSNGLDRISVSRERPFTPKAPEASYAIPQGFFLAGLSPNGAGIPGVMFAPAYLPITWYNTSFDANQYHWTMPDIYGTGTYTSSEENPTARYIPDGYYFPALTVDWDGKESEPYSWERETPDLPYEKAVFFTGGTIAEQAKETGLDIPGLGVGNFNLINGIAPYMFAPGDYWFGTTLDNSTDGIANFFDEPAQPYVLNGVNIAVANFKAPAGTTLHLIIHRVVNEQLLDTIATAQWTTDKAMNEPEFYNLAFTLNELLINDALLIELTGFNQKAGVSFACFSEELHANKEENHAYLFTFNEKNERTLITPDVISPGNYTSLCFSLDMVYSFIGPKNLNYLIEFGPESGQKTVDMDTYYPSENWRIVSELPEWLTMTVTNNQITFTAVELPEGFERHSVDVVISDGKGGLCIFQVVQDLFVGIDSPRAGHQVRILTKGDSVELIYPGEWFNSATVYTVSGQKTASYALSPAGRFILPASVMNRGVYIIRLGGKTAETIRIVR
ncbi:MAG: T9SS type A sorting domain-containing protein [Candidatus Symbiothrix sp.]|nr:T9SS type A sorting domain-containing protein [Candidatus Symbiothrix sp.]